tara:strand:- start:195 stop:1058 length:864 start_codon:yes stop_codon:yes gene_type:complete
MTTSMQAVNDPAYTPSNWIITLTYNNLALTKAAINSFRSQDIEGGVKVLVVDNGSSDNTRSWLHTQPDLTVIFSPVNSVAGGWNKGLRWLFESKWIEGKPVASNVEHVLVCNNDVLLRPDTYRWLVADGGRFVTAVGDDSADCLVVPEGGFAEPLAKKRPHPDFSCYLIHKSTWKTVGEFDEQFKIAYCEDWDMHCRLHQAGITAECIDLPFYHMGAATVNSASAAQQRKVRGQADLNREAFQSKWGMAGGSPEYYDYFSHEAPTKAASDHDPLPARASDPNPSPSV